MVSLSLPENERSFVVDRLPLAPVLSLAISLRITSPLT